MNTRALFLAVAAAAACSSSPDQYIAGFAPPAPKSGYQRYIAPAVHDLMPGDDILFCQWVEPPSDVDRQIIDVTGYQTKGGHHMVLYATTEAQPVGTTRPCTTDDMLSVRFVGAIGGEGLGANDVQLPDGLAFSVPKGQALMMNTHYINATDAPVDGQSVADVKFADPNKPLAPVGFLYVNWDTFTIPANGTLSGDGYCTAPQQLSLFLWTNHMHEWGVSASSEIVRADGTHVPLASDPTWSYERAFNPQWTKWDPSTPFIVNAGDKFHLSCNWHNTTDKDMMFPTEMCVGTGFVLEDVPQLGCEATASGG